LLPALDHLADQLRRILEVGVEHRDGIAAGVLETGGQRRLVAEVARQVHDAQPRVALGESIEDLGRAIGRAIVDDDQLILECRERAGRARVELLDKIFLVVDRSAYAQQADCARWICRHCRRSRRLRWHRSSLPTKA
jgi:hypothetical protein